MKTIIRENVPLIIKSTKDNEKNILKVTYDKPYKNIFLNNIPNIKTIVSLFQNFSIESNKEKNPNKEEYTTYDIKMEYMVSGEEFINFEVSLFDYDKRTFNDELFLKMLKHILTASKDDSEFFKKMDGLKILAVFVECKLKKNNQRKISKMENSYVNDAFGLPVVIVCDKLYNLLLNLNKTKDKKEISKLLKTKLF